MMDAWERFDPKRLWSRYFSRNGLHLPFVKVDPLPGIHRWRMHWRHDPKGPWIMSMFIAGSPKTMEDTARNKNAQLEARWRARRDRIEKIKQEHRIKTSQPRPRWRTLPARGEHRAGDWKDCPVCRDAKFRPEGGGEK